MGGLIATESEKGHRGITDVQKRRRNRLFPETDRTGERVEEATDWERCHGVFPLVVSPSS